MTTFSSKRRGIHVVASLITFVVLLAVYLQSRPNDSISNGTSASYSPDATTLAAAVVSHVARQTTAKRPPFHKKRADAGSGSDNGAAELEFHDFVCKGDLLVQYMSMTVDQITADLLTRGKITAGGSSQSRYTQLVNLQTNGWRKNSVNPNIQDELNFDEYIPITDALTSLGLSTSKAPNGDNTLVAWEHASNAIVNGKQYWATHGDYTNVYNPRQGVIIANFNFGPAHQIGEEPDLKEQHPDIVPPPLKQWSDVAFLEYQAECQAQNHDMKNLKYIFRYGCQNYDTSYVVDAIFDPDQANPDNVEQAPLWSQRKVYTLDTEQGKALLGTPNGNGIAWFLIQHRQQLGQKRVKSVSIFRENEREGVTYTGPCLLFEIEEAN
ncbi:hypothetical protein LTR36_002262 [Oleoguttula mirabilis]|uniref:Uncharacterized protein n=1 Tax=Oleoguttula mirabilis TaxID=1507867 RepID=A0AAV9JLL3_9PEZI|nr:hypothetical protein LTR36_002262 [Oleoguttula mirabilis]